MTEEVSETHTEYKTGDKGVITLFTLTDCPHCLHVKTIFKEKGWAYNNIDIGLYPERRKDMLELADRLTVPQIFFNNVPLGGASDIAEKSPEELEKLFEENITNGGDVKLDSRLKVPNYEPKPKEKPSSLKNDIVVHIGNWKGSVTDTISLLRSELDIGDRKYHLVTYKNCFLGTNMIDTILRVGGDGVTSRDDACDIANGLLNLNVLHHVTYDHRVKDKELFYRLQIHEEHKSLNNLLSWHDRVHSDPMVTMNHVKDLINTLVRKYTDKENQLVDYVAVKNDPGFVVFDKATCEFQKVDMETMDIPTRTAFVINLYNMMIPHAFAKLGAPSSSFQRGAFFDNVGYIIGGQHYSFSELENGILRGNKVPPYHFSKPFSKSDVRIKSANPTAEPRIHFALNCGAKSCPPVKSFSVEALEEELRLVSLAFLEQDTGFQVDKQKNSITLSAICKWYATDFGENQKEVVRTLTKWLRGDTLETVNEMLDSGKEFKVNYFPYDWTNNAKKTDQCTSSNCVVQ